MKRLSGRRVPPANSVPQGTRPTMPPRRSRNRQAQAPRLRKDLAVVGGAALATVPLVILVSQYLILLTIALLVVTVLMSRQGLYRPLANHTSQARTPMIQDLLKGLFGPQAAPASPPQIDHSTPPVAMPEATTPTVPAPAEAAPVAVLASDNPKLPTVAKPVVIAIEAKISRILETLRTVDLGDMTHREVTDLRDVHLPALIRSYIDIPADHRAQIFKEKGKSASYVLKDSLDVIAERLDATIAQLAKREISTFDDTNRFITDRYGNREDPFA